MTTTITLTTRSRYESTYPSISSALIKSRTVSLIIDEDGPPEFLPKLILDLIAEFGGEAVNEHIGVSPSHYKEGVFAAARNGIAAWLSCRDKRSNPSISRPIHDLNLSALLLARELSRNDPLLGEIVMGLNEHWIDWLTNASYDELIEMSSSGCIVFAPRLKCPTCDAAGNKGLSFAAKCMADMTIPS